jgi:hypothetical protein
VALAQRQLTQLAQLGAGQTLSFGVAPLAGSRLFICFTSRSTGDPTPGPDLGGGIWTRVGGALVNSPSASGAGAVWTKMSVGASDQSSLWTLSNQPSRQLLVEVTGNGSRLDTATVSDSGSATTSPLLSLNAGPVDGLAYEYWTHAGGIHFDAGNNPNGDYPEPTIAGWTELVDDNEGPDTILASRPYLGLAGAIQAQYRDFNAGNGTWGGALLLISGPTGSGFRGEPGGGIW